MLISRRRKIDLSKHRKKAIIHWQWLVCVCLDLYILSNSNEFNRSGFWNRVGNKRESIRKMSIEKFHLWTKNWTKKSKLAATFLALHVTPVRMILHEDVRKNEYLISLNEFKFTLSVVFILISTRFWNINQQKQSAILMNCWINI